MLYLDSDIKELTDQMTSATAKHKVRVWAGERRGITIGTWQAVEELSDSDLRILSAIANNEIVFRREKKQK